MTDTFDDIQRSYGRCLRHKDFIGRFYEILMASQPRIAPLFARTDFGRQRKALRRGISIAISYGGGSAIVRRPMEDMARVHSRQGRAPVPPELHDYWLESLIRTIHESDPEADAVLEQRWRQALAPTIALFRECY